MDKVMKLTYSSSLTRFCELNHSFDSAKLMIAYHGKNRNGSYISKESFERAIPSMFNCPVVCRYDRSTNSIGSHDVEVVKDDDGKFQIINVTTPVGVVPESASWSWEDVTEPDGSSHEYLTTDILLWKRQEAYAKIIEDGIEAQSMEIEVRDGYRRKQDDVFVIDNFVFTAFCLLGDSVEPCFESASVEVYSASMAEFKKNLDAMMADLAETYSSINSPIQEVEIKDNLTEGGEVLDEKLALVQEHGFTVDELDFALDDMTVDELRSKLSEMQGEHFENADETLPAEAAEGENNEPVDNDADQQFALNSELHDGLCEAVMALDTVEHSWGKEPKFWMIDFDPDRMEVYATSEEDWHLYGFRYSLNGDNVVIDIGSQRRMKWAIVEFDEGDDADPVAHMFGSVVAKYAESNAALICRVDTVSSTVSGLESELAGLRKFKEDVIEAEKKAEKEAVFSRFEDLADVESFKNLKDNCDNLSPEEIEEKCFAIRGRENTKVTFTRDTKSPRIKVCEQGSTSEPYGGIFSEYGVK